MAILPSISGGLSARGLTSDRLDGSIKNLDLKVFSLAGEIETGGQKAALRARAHRDLLKSLQITDLSELGELTISDNVIAKSGVLRPGPAVLDAAQSSMQVWTHGGNAQSLSRRNVQFRQTRPMSFPTNIGLKSRKLVTAARNEGDIFIEDAFWVAETIRIADDATVLFNGIHGHLTMICRTLIIGERVVFTWEAPAYSDVDPARVDARDPNRVDRDKHDGADRGPSTGHVGRNGVNGGNGGNATAAGASGQNGADAPVLELWALKLNRWPTLAFDGQDGGPGWPGFDGGNGGDGADGLNGELTAAPPFFLNPGDGGNGGRGGRASAGGYGGSGGHGGQLIVFAPRTVFTTLGRIGPFVSTKGGKIGDQGADGRRGRSGRGGAGGRWFNVAAPDSTFMGVRLQGEDGDNGRADDRLIEQNASTPRPRSGGDFGPDAVRLRAISEDEFIEKFSAPRVARVEPSFAKVHDRVRLVGENFSPTDTVLLRAKFAGPNADFIAADGVEIRGSTQISFTLPDVGGGMVEIAVQPKTGPAGIIEMLVQPTILQIEPAGRLTPGTRARIIGTGFAPTSRVYLAGSDANTGTQFIDKNTLSFVVHRVAGPVRNSEKNGEVRDLFVSHGLLNSSSTPTQITIDTFRVVVLGDSVLWGQGHPQDQGEPMKIHELVAAGLEERFQKAGNPIGIHVTNMAHSGAIIGFDDTGRELIEDASGIQPNGAPAVGVGLAQEVNSSFPTILSQAERRFEGRSDTVDLVILDGGINDMNVRRMLPSVDDANLKRLIDLHCGDHMERLLQRVARKFPSAVIVVTGYYPIISNASDLGKMWLYLGAMGVTAAVAAAMTAQYFLSLNPVAGVATALTALQTDKLIRGQLAHNCKIFYEYSEKATQRAIDRVNLRLAAQSRAAARRIYLAAPEFEDEDAVFAPKAKLFGLDALGGALDDPTVRDARKIACAAYYPGAGDGVGKAICEAASAGHPNVDGVKLFAREILATLDMNGVFAPARFRPDFLWGSATASFQVEGGITNNDWHLFSSNAVIKKRVAEKGKPVGLDISLTEADQAAGHSDIETVRRDLDRMKALGMNAYRFSIEWARIEPIEGARDDRTDVQQAYAYYEQVIDAIRERQMQPIVTLNHVTLPSWILTPPVQSVAPLPGVLDVASDTDPNYLASKQGWAKGDAVDFFVDYVGRVVERFANKVEYWLTINEPVATTIGVGYMAGMWSPGFFNDGSKATAAYFNLLRAHAKAYDKIKSIYARQRRECKVGFAHHVMASKLPYPEAGIGVLDNASASEMAKSRAQFDYYYTWHFLDSLLRPEVNESLELENPRPTDSATFFGAAFRPRLDFIGVNYYRSVTLIDGVLGAAAVAGLRAAGAGYMAGVFEQNLDISSNPHQLTNDLTWEIYPRGLYDMIKKAHARYDGRVSFLITENGTAEALDHNRAPHVVAHVQHLLRASVEGVPILGYLHWSIVDNYEWFEGYRPQARFGLFTADLPNQPTSRHITEGAVALQYLIAENGVGRAVERFGVYHPKGYRVTPPILSAGLNWHGQFNAAAVTGAFSLYITRRADGTDTGMIFLEATGLWHPLRSAVAREFDVSFEFARGSTVITCTADVQDLGKRLNGLLSSVGTNRRVIDQKVRWQADRPVLYGTWSNPSQEGVFAQFSNLEGASDEWRGKMWRESKSDWKAATDFSVPLAADEVKFKLGALSFDLKVTPAGALDGTENAAGVAASRFGLIRLSSGIS